MVCARPRGVAYCSLRGVGASSPPPPLLLGVGVGVVDMVGLVLWVVCWGFEPLRGGVVIVVVMVVMVVVVVVVVALWLCNLCCGCG